MASLQSEHASRLYSGVGADRSRLEGLQRGGGRAPSCVCIMASSATALFVRNDILAVAVFIHIQESIFLLRMRQIRYKTSGDAESERILMSIRAKSPVRKVDHHTSRPSLHQVLSVGKTSISAWPHDLPDEVVQLIVNQVECYKLRIYETPANQKVLMMQTIGYTAGAGRLDRKNDYFKKHVQIEFQHNMPGHEDILTRIKTQIRQDMQHSEQYNPTLQQYVKYHFIYNPNDHPQMFRSFQIFDENSKNQIQLVVDAYKEVSCEMMYQQITRYVVDQVLATGKWQQVGDVVTTWDPSRTTLPYAQLLEDVSNRGYLDLRHAEYDNAVEYLNERRGRCDGAAIGTIVTFCDRETLSLVDKQTHRAELQRRLQMQSELRKGQFPPPQYTPPLRNSGSNVRLKKCRLS